ncbi:MAG: toll/interleukin-1 receptor domain-containing protein [Bacteroidales bacterium]
MSKNLIFISHSVPEDNYLAAWLASKLGLIGYEVWVDVEDLRSGSSFWNEIELKMRNESIRFIALISSNYINKALNKNTGVFSEVTLAKSLSKKIDNYIIPLRIDGSDYDDFPINILPLDTIDFSDNWGSGLKKLLKELELQEILASIQEPNTLSLWHKFQGIRGEAVEQYETFGSNWFYCDLPKRLTVYRFQGDLKKLYEHIPFPFIRDGDFCMGFFDNEGLGLIPEYIEDIQVPEFILEDTYSLDNGHIIKDTKSKLTNLMNKAIYYYFYVSEDFKAYTIANKRKVIYPISTNTNSKYISFSRRGKRGRRKLKGRSPVNWSFGLSFIFQLYPFPHYVANHHILSSDKNGFFGKQKQLEYRRSIPKEWYNRHWFERIIAFMSLANGSKNSSEFTFQPGREKITLHLDTVCFESDLSYEETNLL